MKKIILIFGSLVLVATLIFFGAKYVRDNSQANIFNNQKNVTRQDQVQYLDEAKAKEITEVYFNEQELNLKILGSDSGVFDLEIPPDERVNFYRFSADKDLFLISTSKKDEDKTIIRVAKLKERKLETLADATLDKCPDQNIVLKGDSDNKTVLGPDGKEIKTIKTDLNRISCVGGFYYLWKSDEFSSDSIYACKDQNCKKIKLPGNLIDFQNADIGAMVILDTKTNQYLLLDINGTKVSRIVNNILPMAAVDKSDIWGISKTCSLYKVVNGKAEQKVTNYQVCNAVNIISLGDSVLVYDGSNYITVKK